MTLERLLIEFRCSAFILNHHKVFLPKELQPKIDDALDSLDFLIDELKKRTLTSG